MPTCLPLAICVAEKAMQEFCKQWLSGLQPSLSLETDPNGEISICSKVTAGDVVPPDHREAHHRVAGQAQKQRRGPSYNRRLQRRAAARKVAAAQQTADKAVRVEVAADGTIPQLDGHGSDEMEQHQNEDVDEWINPNPDTGLWMYRCCTYAHCFPTEDDLKQHHDNPIFE